jgi:hypothetical protein
MIFFVPFLSTRHQYAMGPSSLECYMTLGLSLQFWSAEMQQELKVQTHSCDFHSGLVGTSGY